MRLRVLDPGRYPDLHPGDVLEHAYTLLRDARGATVLYQGTTDGFLWYTMPAGTVDLLG